jgi:hypothetical protein
VRFKNKDQTTQRPLFHKHHRHFGEKITAQVTPVARLGGIPGSDVSRCFNTPSFMAMKCPQYLQPKQNRAVLHPLPLSSLQQIQRRTFVFILQGLSKLQTNHEPHQRPCLEEQISESRPLLKKTQFHPTSTTEVGSDVCNLIFQQSQY